MVGNTRAHVGTISRQVLALLALAGWCAAAAPRLTTAEDVTYLLPPARLPFAAPRAPLADEFGLWQLPESDLIRLPATNTSFGAVMPVATFFQPPAGGEMGVVAQDNVNAPEEANTEERPPGSAPTGDRQEPIGRAPENTNNQLNFLRSATVLLQPGQMQVDWGGRYVFRDLSAFDILVPFVRRNRNIFSPFAVRYGLTERAQVYANVPVGFSIGEFGIDQPSPLGTDHLWTGIFTVGDSSAGMNYLLQHGQCDEPDIIGTVGFTAPTGHHPFQDIADPLRLKPTPFSGSGLWSTNVGLTVIKTYDPCVVFGTLGYTHYFSRTFGDGPTGLNGARIVPGGLYSYGLGMGFAINDRITLSTVFNGAFQTTTIFDRVQTIGGISTTSRNTFNLEVMQVRLALTATISRNQIVEPFVAFGLTRDTPNADLGVTSTHTF